MKRCLCGQVMAQSTDGSTCHGCLVSKQRARNQARKHLVPGARCYCCGMPATCMDHEIPLDQGGSHALHNLSPMCGPCNQSKYNRDRCYLEHGSRGIA